MWHSQINNPTYFSMSSNQHSIYVIPFLPTLTSCMFFRNHGGKKERTKPDQRRAVSKPVRITGITMKWSQPTLIGDSYDVTLQSMI